MSIKKMVNTAMVLAMVFSAVSPGFGGFVNVANAETTTATAVQIVSDSAISSFNLSGNDGNIILNNITVTVPSGTDVSALAPTIAFTGASISPAIGVAQDFTNPVTYTVYAADGSPQNFIVTVIVATNPDIIAIAGGQVAVGLSSDNPSAKLMAAGTVVTLASFNFLVTTTEDIEIDYLYLTQVATDTNLSSYKDYDEIWFEDATGKEISGTRMTPTSAKPYMDFLQNAFVVEADGSAEVLYLKAKLAAIDAESNGVAGHYLGYKIANVATDVAAIGETSGSASLEFAGTTAPTGLIHHVYKGYPIINEENVTPVLANGIRDLFKFTVYAINSSVALHKFTFDIITNGATVSDLYVYDVTDLDEKQLNITAGTASLGIWESFGWDGVGASDNQVIISPIQPRTFVVRGDVASVSEPASVSVHMVGDADCVAGTDTLMHTIAEVDNDANDNFIWSDMSASDHSTGAGDWTNGYLVSGLLLTSETPVVASPVSDTENLVINLNVEANDYRVKLAWENLNTEGNDPIRYTIYRSTSTLAYPSWREEVDRVNQNNITEVQDFNLEPGVDYYYFVYAFDSNSSMSGRTGWVGPVRISKKFVNITSIKGGESFMGGTEHNLVFEIVDPSIVDSLNIFFTSNSNYGVGYIFCLDSLGGSCVWKVPEGYDYVSDQAQVSIAPYFKENIHTTRDSGFKSEKFSIIASPEQSNFLWTKPEVINNIPTGGNVQITGLDSKYDHYGVLHAVTSYTMYGSRDGLENVEQISGISYSKREGGLWSAPERVYEFVTTTSGYYPIVIENLNILINGASKLNISWTLRNNFSGSNIDLDKQGFYYSTKENNEWSNEKIGVSDEINEARIAMDNEDNVYLIWLSREYPEGGEFSLYYTKKAMDSSWSDVKNVFDSQIVFSNLFDLVITDNGNAHIIYSKFDFDIWRTWHAIMNPSGEILSDTLLPVPELSFGFNILADGNNLHSVFSADNLTDQCSPGLDGCPTTLDYMYFDDNAKKWSEPRIISGFSYPPAINLTKSKDGVLHILQPIPYYNDFGRNDAGAFNWLAIGKNSELAKELATINFKNHIINSPVLNYDQVNDRLSLVWSSPYLENTTKVFYSEADLSNGYANPVTLIAPVVTPPSNDGSSGGGGGGGSIQAPAFIAPAVGGFSVVINNGAAETNSVDVNLTLGGGAAARMAISNSSDFSNISQEAYQTTRAWKLPDVFGEKTVFVKFYDQNGTTSLVVSATIKFVSVTTVTPTIQTPTQASTGQVLGVKITRTDELIAKLKFGQRGTEVNELQNELKRLGFLAKSYKTTNYYGNITAAGVAKYKDSKKQVLGVKIVNIDSLIAATKFGTKNNNVKLLQGELKKAGFYPKDWDLTGYYGPVTKAGVKKYKASNK